MKKSRDRNLRTKIAFKMKQKAFFITFNGLSIKQITQFFWKVRVRLKFATLTFILLLPFKNKDRKHKKKNKYFFCPSKNNGSKIVTLT